MLIIRQTNPQQAFWPKYIFVSQTLTVNENEILYNNQHVQMHNSKPVKR